jgi:hypothetical protein
MGNSLSNELPRDKPGDILDGDFQKLSRKPRFLPIHPMWKAGKPRFLPP